MFGIGKKQEEKLLKEDNKEEIVFFPNLKKNTHFPDSKNTGVKYSTELVKSPIKIPYIKEKNSAKQENLRELEISKNIKLKGEIGDCDKLILSGHVETDITLKELIIEKGGFFAGNATVKKAIIKGEFEGQITACEKLIIRPSGSVKGKVFYSALEVEKGGKLNANVENIPTNNEDINKS